MTAIMFIIVAWATKMPLWASITITALAGIRLQFQMAAAFGRFVEHGKGNGEHNDR